MNLKIKLLHPNARMPEYKTAGASGMDLYAVERTWLDIGATALVPLGIAVEIPTGYEAQIRPRSSMTRQAILSHFGTIDSDYRGEIMAALTNLNILSATIVETGDRIAQLVIAPIARPDIYCVTDLSETVRGAGGFGHTGR